MLIYRASPYQTMWGKHADWPGGSCYAVADEQINILLCPQTWKAQESDFVANNATLDADNDHFPCPHQ